MHTAYLQILHLWASRDFFPLPNTTLSAPLAPERYCISLAESLLEICSATQRAKYSARDMQYLSSLLETTAKHNTTASAPLAPEKLYAYCISPNTLSSSLETLLEICLLVRDSAFVVRDFNVSLETLLEICSTLARRTYLLFVRDSF